MIDYMQLMDAPDVQESRQQQISEISRGIKAVARELEIPVIALSQLNRMAEGRDGHRPRMSDLRESGSIEQDADIVLFIYREDYYVASKEPKAPKDDDDIKIVEAYAQWQQDMGRVYGLAEVIVAKQRHGSTGKVRLKFDSRITKFSDVADESYLPQMNA